MFKLPVLVIKLLFLSSKPILLSTVKYYSWDSFLLSQVALCLALPEKATRGR